MLEIAGGILIAGAVIVVAITAIAGVAQHMANVEWHRAWERQRRDQ